MNTNNDQPNAVENPTPDKSQHSFIPTYKSMHLPTIIMALAVLIAIVGGAVWYSHTHQTANKGYSYHYDKSTGYVLGKGKGYAIVISRPDAINKILPGIKTDANSKYFVQLSGKSRDTQSDPAIAYLALKSRPYPKPVLGTSKYRDAVSKTLNNTSSARYSETVTNAKQFAAQLRFYRQEPTFGPAKPFTNDSVKNYAWQFDLTTQDAKYKDLLQQGKVLYILGKNGWYYVMITAEKTNWQNNQPFFQKVINSVRVDQ